jgi:diaminopimelate decarboxylase
MVGLAKRVFPVPPLYIDIGGGFYGEMPVSLKSTFSPLPPDFDQYAEVVCEAMTGAYSGSNRMPALYIEPGTALVANTVKFYTKIFDIKTIAGRRIATVAGSIFDISPYARALNLPVRAVCRREPTLADQMQEGVDIAGYTCIESDYLTKGLRVQLEVGDFVEYSNVGSYTVVMKPPFIAPHAPILQSSGKSGEFRLIRSRGTGAAVLSGFRDF